MIVTRFAPSPTGLLHVGNLRIAIANALLSRAAGGQFLLRFDDTDDTRSEARFVEAIRTDLHWLGLRWDAEHHQADRLDLYEQAAAALRDSSRLYACYETPEELEIRRRVQRAAGRPPVYDRSAQKLSADDKARLEAEGRRPHWRFLLEHETVRWHDGVQGDSHIDLASVSDPVLIRADGRFLYTLASVVDDSAMGISDIVRGADHITNTAVQIQIFSALGAVPPRFAHLSLLTGPGGAALSKRERSLSIGDLRKAGIEAMALTSALARLGSSRNVEPLADLDAAAEGFALEHFGTAPVVFDDGVLQRLSMEILHGLPFDAVADRLVAMGIAGPKAAPFWSAVQPNLTRLADATEWWSIVNNGAEPVVEEKDSDFVDEAMGALPPRPWDGDTWKAWTSALKASSGRKGAALFKPLRRALTGKDSGPDMAALMPLLEKP